MKLTAILLTCAFINIQANGISQTVTLSGKNMSLEKVFSAVKKQTGYLFFYNTKMLKDTRKVSINVKDVKLDEFLKLCFNEQPVDYLIEQKTIVIVRKKAIPFSIVNPSLQSDEERNSVTSFSLNIPATANGKLIIDADTLRTITGKITDNDGKPVERATIAVLGTNIATSASSSGTFTIRVPATAKVLLVSSVGFEETRIAITSSGTMNVVLKQKVTSVDEVVVVGYGSQKRAKVTGAVTTVNGDDMRKMTVTNNSLNLAGRVPGLISLNTSGRPGTGASVSIRGVSSFNNAPALYVIDGTIRNKDNFDQLDPNEIESISVLKDAGSAAVYGVRATNGIIVVTTKRGKTGKTGFSLSAITTFDRPTRYPNVMDAYEYATFKNEANDNMGQTRSFTREEIEGYRTGKLPSTDWMKVTYKDYAPSQQYNVSLNGGTELISYFFSLGYLDQKGIYDNLDYSRYNFRSNIDINLTKTLKAAINMEGRVVNRSAPNIAGYNDPTTADWYLWRTASKAFPTILAYYPDGKPRYDISADTHTGETTKKSGYNRSIDNLFIGQVALTQKLPFIEGLSAKGSVQIWRQFTFEKRFNKQYPTYTEDDDGNVIATKMLGIQTTAFEKMYPANSYTLNLSMDYDRTFGKHSVKGLLLYEQYSMRYDELSGSRTNYPFSTIDELFAGSDDDQRTINGSASEDGRLGIIGRVNYDYNTKYLFEASFRNDASYRFVPNKRWGFFPSVSAGWVLSREKFMENAKFVDFLKLRGSYGILGNDIVGGFQWRSSYGLSGDYYFSENPVKWLATSVVPNPDLTWEKTATANIGLDATFWNRLLGVTIDVFQKNTYDIYGSRTNQYPGVYGASLPAQNYGKVDVRGYEVSLSHDNKLGELMYKVTGNFSFSRNQVKVKDHNPNIEPWNNPIGKPVNYRTGYIADGLYQTDKDAATSPRIAGTNPKAGDIKYRDLNGDGVIDYRDVSILSWYSNQPEIIYGLNVDASWENFDFNIFFQGVANRNIMFDTYARNSLYNGNSFKYFLDRWTPDNPDAKYPRAWIGTNAVNNNSSTFWLRDGKFLRLKNIQIAYNLPKSILERIRLKNVRFSLAGYNLFVFDKIKDFDPEMSAGDGFYYPQNKSIVAGINVSF